MLTPLLAMLAQAPDPAVVVAPAVATWPQVWLALITVLSPLVAAAGASISLWNAVQLRQVRHEVNGRVEELVEARAGRAQAEDAGKAQAGAAARVEQALAEFVAYTHQRNHDVLGGVNAVGLRTEAARLTVEQQSAALSARVEDVARDLARVLAALQGRPPAPPPAGAPGGL